MLIRGAHTVCRYIVRVGATESGTHDYDVMLS